MNEKIQKYLPSKEFTKSALAVVSLLIFIFIIFFAFSKKNIFFNKGDSTIKTEEKTVNALLQSDADRDGVFDWEEALWGTDKNIKNTFGISDSEYISNKKKELNIEQDQLTEEENTNETDKFARQWFATYVAMKDANDINPNTINNFSSSVGQNVVTSQLTDIYSLEDIKIAQGDNMIAKTEYYQNIKNLFNTYKSIGKELDIVSSGLVSYTETGTNANYEELSKIGGEYIDYGLKVLNISVPISLKEHALKIANSSNNVGLSINKMTKITNDPLIGLEAISNYQKYTDELIEVVAEIEAILK